MRRLDSGAELCELCVLELNLASAEAYTVTSVAAFVERFGEGHPMRGAVSDWLLRGGSSLVCHVRGDQIVAFEPVYRHPTFGDVKVDFYVLGDEERKA